MFTITNHDEPIDLSKGSTLEKSAPLLPNQEQEYEKVGATTVSSDNVNFDWIDCALTILSKKGSTTLKKLKKKVVNKYLNLHPETIKTRVELERKFDKKIGKSNKFEIANEVVSASIFENHSIHQPLDLSVPLTQKIEVHEENPKNFIDLSNLQTQLVKPCQDTKKG